MDDSLAEKRYVAAIHPTPAVRFTYDPDFSRVRTMQDGNGLTAFAYHPTPAAGAGRLASIDGPWTNDTITFGYDELGRATSRAVNNVAVRQTFDPGGRVTQLTNSLGVFDLTWEVGSARLSGVHYPNGQATEYGYYPGLRDRLLQRITHRLPNNTVLSEFAHAYNAQAQLTSWTQSQGGVLKTSIPAYDSSERLIGFTTSQSGSPDQVLGFVYGASHNRRSEQADGVARDFSYNALNQLTAISDTAAPPAAYEWDAENRLVVVSKGAHRTEFSYDGFDRRSGIVEKENGSIVSERRLLWNGLQLCEERDATGSVTLKRFSSFGVVSYAGSDLTPGNYFFTRDHLCSVREMSDQSGTVRGRFAYSPYGDRQRLSGDLEPGFGFTGHPLHLPSSLHLAPFRAYDSRLGRWISRDPAQEAQGPNLYAYVSSDPLNFIDPLGRQESRAGALVNTGPAQDLRAGVADYNKARGVFDTGHQILDDGVLNTGKAKVQGMGEDALKNIVPGAQEEQIRLMEDIDKTSKEGVKPAGRTLAGHYGTAGDALLGKEAKPCPPHTGREKPAETREAHWYDWFVDLFSSPSEPPPPPRDGKISPKSLNDFKAQTDAANLY